jgi:hypothetical protein
VYRAIAPPEKEKGGLMKWVTLGTAVVALGAGGYFGYGWYTKHQEEANATPGQAEKSSDGGKTAPSDPRDRTGKPLPAAGVGADPAKSAEKELPVIPAVWTLDIATAKIPEGRANGKISGTNFVVETAGLGIIGNAHVLSLRQGPAASPDREILVYLHPKAGESLTGHVWTVSKDMKGAGVPQVAKRWKTNPKFAPTLKSFSAGYAMKLELGQINNGEISGKVFIALPDAEQSVVAGVFQATTSLATPASPIANPSVPAPAPVADPAFEKRYGTKR